MFKHRSQEKETMDDLNCSGEVVDQTLRELELINKWLGGNRVTLNGLDRVINNTDSKNLRIADLGCGSGSTLKMISNWASKKNKQVDLTGIDANPNIVEYARRNCKPYPQIKFQALDVFSSEFKPQIYDIVISTLFTHHFSNEQLVRLLKQLLDQ
ncbi:MAG: methyltransferase domain-containing protein, partial [Bacteroidetes bacterium]|nr:methyltransferase domain-containing protein [Bacteroidota bacterium]